MNQGQESRNGKRKVTIFVAKIICLNREMTGSTSGKLQCELMELAKEANVNCVVDIVCRPTIQYEGEFKDYVHLEISHDGSSVAVMEKIEELIGREYSLQVMASSFYPSPPRKKRRKEGRLVV